MLNVSGLAHRRHRIPESNLWQVAERKLVHAKWAPTSDEEHAVSILTEGPFKPSVKETRPHAALRVPDVAE